MILNRCWFAYRLEELLASYRFVRSVSRWWVTKMLGFSLYTHFVFGQEVRVSAYLVFCIFLYVLYIRSLVRKTNFVPFLVNFYVHLNGKYFVCMWIFLSCFCTWIRIYMYNMFCCIHKCVRHFFLSHASCLRFCFLFFFELLLVFQILGY